MRFSLLFVLLFSVFSLFAIEPGKGSIAGKIVDAKNADVLIGVSVFIENTTVGCASDIDGNFVITGLNEGKYNVVFKYIGYQQKIERDVVVESGKATSLNISMKEEQVNLTEVVVKSDIVKHDNASAIFVMQKNSTTISSGISSEDIKKSPDRNSGEVIKRMSGATISEGKYAVIRGLADRYNLALVNGQVLPSTEPDRKTFAFDIFPSNLLENLIIYKTAQPDLPSEFAGGIINMNTRDIPEKSFFSANYGINFIQGSAFKPYTTYAGGKTDFLGFDDGTRALPKNFASYDSLETWSKYDKRKYAEAKKLSNKWGTKQQKMAYPGQSLQLSGSFAKRFKKTELGGVFSVNYSNNIKRNDILNRQSISGVSDTDWVYNDERYINTTQLGALANIAAVFNGVHKISWKNTFNQNGEDITTLRKERDINTGFLYDREIYQFTATTLYSTQLTGEHFFKGPDIKWRWYGGYVLTKRTQPNTRGVSHYSFNREDDDADTLSHLAAISSSYSPLQGSMFYTDLRDNNYNAGTDLTVPFKILKSKQSFKTGFYFQHKDRVYSSRIFGFIRGNSFSNTNLYKPTEALFDTANFNSKGFTIDEITNKKDSYKASTKLYATYAMFENSIASRLKIVWGVRFEYFRQVLESFDQTNHPANRDNKYFTVLPSANFIVSLNEKSNFRASYSMTTSRPEFRELVDNAFYDFSSKASITGNPDLKQTTIHNADLRYEYYFGRGQAFTVSAFYKKLMNPIEQIGVASNSVSSFTFSGNNNADVAGVELEFRKNFDFMNKISRWKQWENFSININAAYIYSRIQIKDSNAVGNKVRPLQGQTPYVVNVGLQYNEPKTDITANILFNMVGPKIFATGNLYDDDLYENGRPVLDLQLSKSFFKKRFLVRFTASDLLAQNTVRYFNAPKEKKTFDPKADRVFGIWKNYRSFSLTFSYSF